MPRKHRDRVALRAHDDRRAPVFGSDILRIRRHRHAANDGAGGKRHGQHVVLALGRHERDESAAETGGRRRGDEEEGDGDSDERDSHAPSTALACPEVRPTRAPSFA